MNFLNNVVEEIESEDKHSNNLHISVEGNRKGSVNILGDGESFHGTGEGIVKSGNSSAKIAARLMKDHVTYIEDGIKKIKNRGFHSDLWHRRHKGTESILDFVDTEASDIITPLPKRDFTTPLSRRVTRSQGPVGHYPYVQPKTLEYKQGKKK